MEFASVRIYLVVFAISVACQGVATTPFLNKLEKQNIQNIVNNSLDPAKETDFKVQKRPSKELHRTKQTLSYELKTKYAVDKVVGGTLAQEGQFPWMAVIHQLLGAGRISMCGGTIISIRWILTAGHCIANGPTNFNVILGIVDKSGIGYDYNEGAGLSMYTTQGALHPQYGMGVNDIALLYLPQDIPFNEKIQPIRLAGQAKAQQTFEGSTAYVFGWGLDGTGYTENQKHLKYGALPIISNAQCMQFWSINDGNICTAPSTGSDACQGDSGGPLIVWEQNQPLQIGIVSFGDTDCPSRRPGVFTKVAAFSNWIAQVTGIQY
ncbi:chymotrypsin-like protease CTRL-1 [Cephus cinctus]|uniref:Chymotrypsin-like protease CTRL-1 n=1 Tax=Cephus cinctus TaxID=211228 RepID=A0AAJ7BMQ8_CEPCN|nr:chymotrypsin-like protease CTRL-1 [Cephus cinctus]XP_024937880.1 chymotrypsin-like protease CTRL-1 [Cephus cinctus]